MRIALFVTCLADTLFPDVGRATVVLLERLGHRVDFPQAQTCCGQMHVNTGYQRDAVPLVVDETDRIVWVAGFGIDEAFRVTDPAQAVLILKLRRGGSA